MRSYCNYLVLSPSVNSHYEAIFYRPQRSLGKVIFSQACVILFTGGVCLSACWDATPQSWYPPPSRYTPREQAPPLDQAPPRPGTPQTRHTPHRSRHPPYQAHPSGAEHAARYGQRAGGTHPTGMQSCSSFTSTFYFSSLHPLFPGSNEVDQIAKIHDVKGTPDPSVLNKLRK